MPTYEVRLRVFVTAKKDDDAFDAANDLNVEADSCEDEAEIDVEQIGKTRRVRRPRRFVNPVAVVHREAAEGEGT
jgi:hypothetical protein